MSFERSIFRWDERVPEGLDSPPAFGGTGTPPSNASVPRPSQGNWAWSPIANRWYATAWGHPAIDFEGGGMEFMKSVVQFWMDNGVQGIEWDAPQSVWGLSNSDARHREIVTYARTAYTTELEESYQSTVRACAPSATRRSVIAPGTRTSSSTATMISTHLPLRWGASRRP